MLNDNELFEVCEACDMAIDLNILKMKVYEYVESRMTYIAPNLSVIVGASTAAQIMGKFYEVSVKNIIFKTNDII